MEALVVGVVGLGYVGLPLAVHFGRKNKTIGFDQSDVKLASYKRGIDASGEVDPADFTAAKKLTFTHDPAALRECDVIVVAVPTPVDIANQPDFGPLVGASQTTGRHMKRGAIVVYESTVYPGATEEVCVPVLEKESGMKWRDGFHVGYSPERINLGDKQRTLTKVTKVVSGDDAQTLDTLVALYGSIVEAGIYQASSIKIAEAAKVIENTQRDLNIALMNELAILFHKIGIDTQAVLDAAGTKWNFLPFRPGLVGGHCIGVDPYYLTHKAEMLGYHSQVILAGRRINDGMAAYVAAQTAKELSRNGFKLAGARVVILGLTFKENCRDVLNSKVPGILRELRTFGCDVAVHDPLASAHDALQEYGIQLTTWAELPRPADAVIAAVSHAEFLKRPLGELTGLVRRGGVFVDVKSAYPADEIRKAGLNLWRL